jgi:Flp pilus assembly protein TadG
MNRIDDCLMDLLMKRISTVLALLHGLADDDRGVSAIEFAVLLPFMILLYIGGVEISQAVGAYRKVTIIAHTVADLVAQSSTSMAASDVSNALSAASAIVTPYSASNLSVVVSQICIDQNGNSFINWSQATPSSSAHAVGTQLTLSTTLTGPFQTAGLTGCTTPANKPGSCLIWGETTYAYAPQLGYAITGTLNMYDQLYLAPRLNPCITYTG